MSMNDTMARVLSDIYNLEKIGKNECLTGPSAKLILAVLGILKHHHYVGDYKVIDDGRGKMIHIHLIGQINKCGVIKPRYSIKNDNYEKFEKRYLPANGFGILVVSTSQGIMVHSEAKKKRLGGVLLAYCY
ncbi:30S ribosomal protein S8 [Candidatus Woesearchaeota archaeon]|nr:30S ribosomal protein S8 [Candidatus Woesearchaeota archaeon]